MLKLIDSELAGLYVNGTDINRQARNILYFEHKKSEYYFTTTV